MGSVSASDVDFWAWRMVDLVSAPEPDVEAIAAAASELVSAGPPLAALTALAGHASTALRLVAAAQQRPLQDVLAECAEVGGLARLEADLPTDAGGHS